MRNFLLSLPAGLATLVLAAHYLRRGNLVFVLACLALFALLFSGRRWATRVVQAGLALGSLEWAGTLFFLTAARRAAGEPWERMAAILAAVLAVTLLGAVLVGRRRPGPPPGGTK